MGKVLISKGQANIAARIDILRDFCILSGTGQGDHRAGDYSSITELRVTTALADPSGDAELPNGAAIKIVQPDAYGYVAIENLCLRMIGAAAGVTSGIWASTSKNIHVKEVLILSPYRGVEFRSCYSAFTNGLWVRGCANKGVYHRDTGDSFVKHTIVEGNTTNESGFNADNSLCIHYHDAYAATSWYNFLFNSASHGCSLVDCTSDYAVRRGLFVDSCNRISVKASQIYNNGSGLGGGSLQSAVYLYGAAACEILDNYLGDSQGSPTQLYGIYEDTGCSDNDFRVNDVRGNITQGVRLLPGSGSRASANPGYIAPGEVSTTSGTLLKTGSTLTNGTGTFTGSVITLKPGANTVTCTAAGTATIVLPAGCTGTAATGTMTVNASPVALVAGSNVITTSGVPGTITVTINHFAAAWHNPELQDIMVQRVVVEISTPGGTATSVIQCGIADDAIGTNLGSEFFTGLNANAAAVYDSYLAGDTGGQTKYIVLQDSASATDGWLNFKINTEVAGALVARYYIEYVGR